MSDVISHYLVRAHGYKYLNEFFNLNFRGISEREGKIEIDSSSSRWEEGGFSNRLPKETAEAELEYRFNLLKHSREKVVLKSFPYKLNGRIRAWALENAQFLFIKRRNTFEHLLSFMVSHETGIFYAPDGIRAGKGSLHAARPTFVLFERLFQELDEFISETPNPRVVYYEDLVSDSPAHFVKKIGFHKEIRWDDLRISSQQNKGNKLELFRNQDELVSWYKHSALSNQFPI